MLKFYITLISSLLLLKVAAQNFNESDSYFNHLVSINKEWANHIEDCPQGTISFTSDIDRIQLHLQLVCASLKKHQPSNLSDAALNNRLELISALESYAANKTFPENIYHRDRQPYFVDHRGVHCAVGQLMAVSGNTELVSRIKKEYNYDYIVDIKEQGVIDWSKQYGFTLDELKWIQPTYGPIFSAEAIANGTNGPVTSTDNDNYHSRLVFAGDFSTVDNLPCLNVGYYDGNQLGCFGNGVSGIVYDIICRPEGVYVYGALESGGDIYPMAFYNDTIWTYSNIPGREGATCTAALRNPYSSAYLELGIKHNAIPNGEEVWQYVYNVGWKKRALVNGTILDMTASGEGSVYAGAFDTIEVYNDNGSIDTAFAVNNTVLNSFNVSWQGLGGLVSDTIYVAKAIGNAVYLGGTCSDVTGSSNVCVSKYLNFSLQPLVTTNDFASWGSSVHVIKDIAYNNGTDLVFSGQFIFNGWMDGMNLANYSLIYDQLYPLAIIQDEVSTVAFFENELIVGGYFTAIYNNPVVPHLAKIHTNNIGINEGEQFGEMSVFPNPFESKIQLSHDCKGADYTIYDQTGRLIVGGTIEDNSISGLDGLAKGQYVLEITKEDNSFNTIIMK